MKTALIVVVAVAAYAVGAVKARRWPRSQPGSAADPWQLLVLCFALAGLAYLRPSGRGPEFLAISLLVMFLLGLVACMLIASKHDHVVGGTREYEDFYQERSVTLWRRWLNFSRAVVDYEFRLLLLAVYLLIVAPVALTFRLFSRAPAGGAKCTWISKSDSPTLATARRPF